MIVRWEWASLASAPLSVCGAPLEEFEANVSRWYQHLFTNQKISRYSIFLFMLPLKYNEENYYVSSPNAIQVVMAVYYLLHNIAFIAWVIHHNNIQVIKGV